MNAGRTREFADGRTMADGLDISIFIGADDNANSQAHFKSQHITDPAPYLLRAIRILQDELADLTKCPAHRKSPAA